MLCSFIKCYALLSKVHMKVHNSYALSYALLSKLHIKAHNLCALLYAVLVKLHMKVHMYFHFLCLKLKFQHKNNESVYVFHVLVINCANISSLVMCEVCVYIPNADFNVARDLYHVH